MNGVGNLSVSTVKALRSSPSVQREREAVTSVSVDYLKNGGTINMNAGGEEASLRNRYVNGRPENGAHLVRQSDLSEAEQIEALKKVKKAAGDYEAVFMEELVKAMKQKPMAEAPGGDAMLDVAQDPFKGFLAQAGGLGLADAIIGQVARQEGLEQTLQKHPDIMGPGWQMKIPESYAKGHSARLSPKPEELELQGQTPEITGSEAAALKSLAPENCPAQDEEVAAVAVNCPASDGEFLAASPLKTQVGLLDDEEIAYLYEDAKEALA